MSENKLYAFDFDGTITRADTFLAFIRHACGTRRFVLGFARFVPMLVMMKLHLYPNDRAKERVFAHFFGGMPVNEFDALCRRFALETRHRLLRPQAVTTIEQALTEGSRVMVVSASIDRWVRPFFESGPGGVNATGGGRVEVMCTQVEVSQGKLTGRFSTPNCYGPEKVRRISEALAGERGKYYVVAFGDSRGDKEMISYADEGHYRPFRQ